MRTAAGGRDARTVPRARFRLEDDAATRALWPHRFVLTLTVSLGPRRLDIALAVAIAGPAPFAFTAALHTYLRVADIAQAATSAGLQGVRYLDTVEPAVRRRRRRRRRLTFRRETDRIYFEVPAPLSLLAPRRRARGGDGGLPGRGGLESLEPRVCATLPDMPPDGYRRMLCLEAAVIDRPVRLDSREGWFGRQTLTAL